MNIGPDSLVTVQVTLSSVMAVCAALAVNCVAVIFVVVKYVHRIERIIIEGQRQMNSLIIRQEAVQSRQERFADELSQVRIDMTEFRKKYWGARNG